LGLAEVALLVLVRKEGSGKEEKFERRVRWKWVRERREARAVGKNRCVESRLETEQT